MPAERYNAVIIGGGPGGLVAAAGLAGLGAHVALIERDRMGGDCLNTGCVPSKALIASAHAAHAFRSAGRYGLGAREPEVDVGAVFERVRQRRAHIAPHDSPERFEKLGVRVFVGEPAVFSGPRKVRAGAVSLEADRFVIATGARAAVPPIDGLAGAPHFTNETFFDRLSTAPASLCVLGGGPIGLELAQAMRRLGVPVTVVEMTDQVLIMEDPDAAAVVRASLEADGVEVLTGHAATKVERGPSHLGETAVRVTLQPQGGGGQATVREFGALLVAVGRAPNVEGMGLEAAGVRFSPKDGIPVDAYLRTSRKHILAIGDVASRYKFTHFADAQARAAVRNILIPWWPARFDDSIVPWCTYTDPECAHVGHNETTAAKAGLEHKVYKFELKELDRPVVDDQEAGFVKVIADPKGKVLGATIVGARAGDTIHEYVMAMKHGIGLASISGTIHAYPTYGEANRRPADAFMRGKLTPFVRRLLAHRWGARGGS